MMEEEIIHNIAELFVLRREALRYGIIILLRAYCAKLDIMVQ